MIKNYIDEKKLIKVSIVISIIIIVFAFLVYKFLKGFIVLWLKTT